MNTSFHNQIYTQAYAITICALLNICRLATRNTNKDSLFVANALAVPVVPITLLTLR